MATEYERGWRDAERQFTAEAEARDDIERAEIERLRKLYRESRKGELGWEIADKFGYEEQSGRECQKFCDEVNAKTERRLRQAARAKEE